MSSYFRDSEFQEKLLAFVCRDRNFLQKTSGLLSPDDFKPKRGEGMQEAYVIAQKAFKYWRDYREPISGMLRTEMLDYIRENKRKIGSKQQEKILGLVESIRKSNGLVAVEAIEQKVLEYKQRQSQASALRELIDLKEKGELTPHRWARICRDAINQYDRVEKISNYTDYTEVEKRIRRRMKNRDAKFPYLMLDAFDKSCRTVPRGEICMGLAKYGVGKSTLTVHLAKAYALQGYKCLVVTTEDPAEMVEDRLDASISGIKIKRLMDKSKRLKRRLRHALQKIRGQIRVLDGTNGDMSIERMEEIRERFRNQGFQSDVTVLDYDEGVLAPEHYKGDSGERKEMHDIYKAYKQYLVRTDQYGWIMAQTTRGKPGVRKCVVTGDDAAIDISKVKRSALVIGVGDGLEEWGDDGRYIYIAKHRYDRPKWGFPIMGDFERTLFYDREATEKKLREHRHKHEGN